MKLYLHALKDYWFVWLPIIGGATTFKFLIAPLMTPKEILDHTSFYNAGTSAVAGLVSTFGFVLVWIFAKRDRDSSN